MTLELGIINLALILDIYWIGRLGSVALAVVTICATIRWVFNSIGDGLGVGGMAVVARRIGENNRVDASRAVWQTILLGLFLSVILGVLGILVSRPLLILLGIQTDALPLGLSYLRASFCGIFTSMLLFSINAMLRGAGEARSAMSVLILTTVATIIIEPILIFGLGPIPPLGIIGSALGFILGIGSGLVMQIILLYRGKMKVYLPLDDLRPDFKLMGRIIRIAFPSTVRTTLRSSSRLAIMALVGFYGTFATAGYGVANQLLTIAVIPCLGFGNAAGTMVGQNLGAKKPERAERAAWWVSAYNAIYMTIIGALLIISAQSLVPIFDPTPEVVTFASECIRIIAPSLVIYSIGLVLAVAFSGAGNTIPPMVINLISLWGIEVTLAYGLSRWLGMEVTGVWWGRSIGNTINGLLIAYWFYRGKWKHQKV